MLLLKLRIYNFEIDFIHYFICGFETTRDEKTLNPTHFCSDMQLFKNFFEIKFEASR